MKRTGGPLCINMSETLTPKEFRIEGEKGFGDEFLEWSDGPGSYFRRGRGCGEGDAASVFGRVQDGAKALGEVEDGKAENLS